MTNAEIEKEATRLLARILNDSDPVKLANAFYCQPTMIDVQQSIFALSTGLRFLVSQAYEEAARVAEHYPEVEGFGDPPPCAAIAARVRALKDQLAQEPAST